MLRKILFMTETGQEITLPVTPATYTVCKGKQVQTVDVYTLGAYTVPTTDARESIDLEVCLPSSNRSYCVQYTEQSVMLAWLLQQIESRAKLRFIVSGTSVNLPVYLTNLEYGEKDGTNDIYGTLTLQPYVTLAAPTVETLTTTAKSTAREETPQQTSATTYTVKDGDNLWNICRKYYGDGSLCYKLAAYNGIKNANLIYAGQVLKIPDKTTLQGTKATQSAQPSTTTAAAKPTTTTTTTTTVKPTSYTVRLSVSGSPANSITYSWLETKTGKSGSGTVKSSLLITVAAGARLYVRWRSSATARVDTVTVDGVASKTSSDYLMVTVNAKRTIDVHWTR